MGCNSEGCCGGRPNTNLKENRIITITQPPKKVEKGWGYELYIHNDDGYCGKVLHFNKGGRFSMHYHVEKRESFYISKGRLILKQIDPDTTEIYEQEVFEGCVIEIYRGVAHQLIALEESDVFEISTPDKPEDSYRVWKGDSQN